MSDWRLLDHADLEREYSPSSCVGGDISAFLAAYETESQKARELAHEHGREIVELRYGSTPSQTIDLVTPGDGPALAPLVVYIHGGYWQLLSKHESFFGAADFLSHGIAYAAVDYTLAPAASLDEIVAECRAAVALLRDRAADYHLDADRIIVCGSSAGGHLSAMVGHGVDDSGWRPAALGLLSGVFDLEPLITTYINDAVGLDSEAARRNSPLFGDLAGFPPAVVAVGSNETDQFKLQSAAMAAAITNAGGSAELIEVAGRNHFDIVHDLGDRSTRLGELVLGLTTAR